MDGQFARRHDKMRQDKVEKKRGRGFENAIDPALSIVFVLRGSTGSIYAVSKQLTALLKSYPDVAVIHSKSSVGKLWIKEGSDQGDGMQ
jgi:hypothetical protein